MWTLGWISMLCLLSAAFLSVAGICTGQDDKVEVRRVKLADLENTIKDLRGKVVVVDFWGFG